MKVTIAQSRQYIGDMNRNAQNVITDIRKAKNMGSDIVVFPELTIPGYLSMDLFHDRNYLEKNKQVLDDVVKNSEGIMALVGFADYEEGKIGPGGRPVAYNSVAVIADGKILGVQDKFLLPEYDIFDENRYFRVGRGQQVFEYKGKKIGVQICEDMWSEGYNQDVSNGLVELGAQMIINLSASPFDNTKLEKRKNLISKISKENNVPFVYANLVGSYDGYDGQVVFDGRSMASDLEGRIVAVGKSFDEDMFTIDLDKQNEEVAVISDDRKDTYDALVMGVKDYLGSIGKKSVSIGLSGGIDSALVAAIAVDALGNENVKGYLMPSKFSSQGSLDDAKALADNLGIEYSILPIQKGADTMESILEEEFKGMSRDVTEENIQARVRGNLLMATSNKLGNLVLSTGNKTEMALGYCTLYGDMSGGLSVISDLNKLAVYDLSRWRNEFEGREVIPQNTIDKAPSAELSEDQTDEEGLGAGYDVLAPLVDLAIEKKYTIEDLVDMGYDRELVADTVRRVDLNEHKRRQAPPGIKVTEKSFGIGRRVPMVHNWR